MTMPDTRRFTVRPDAFYVRRADGVRLSNNAGSFTIRGAGAYQLVAAVFGNLDGERTLDDLVSGLPEMARRSVLELVATLARNGFVAEARHPAEPVPDWLRQLYPAQLDFLDLHADRPVTRFHRARSAPLLVAGGGVALAALLGALTDFGLARLHVLTTKAADEQVTEVLAAAVRRDSQLRYEVHHVDEIHPTDLVDRAGQLDAPMVLIADETLDDDPDAVARVGAAQRRLRDSGRGLGVLGRCADFTVALPGGPDSCWGCLHRWLAARAVAVTGQPLPLAAAPAAIAALHLAQHAFTTLAGVPRAGFGRIATVEPIAPIVRTHKPRRHPSCPLHESSPPPTPRGSSPATPSHEDDLVRPDIPAAEDSAALVAVADRIVTVTSGWTDHLVGPIHHLAEGDADQLPLAMSICRVAEPDSTAAAQLTTRVACRAVSPREARNQVVLAALEHLARRLAVAAGVLPPDWFVGAGWSRTEAGYRARLAASAAVAVDAPAPAGSGTGSATDAVTSPIGAFLVDELAAGGREWRLDSAQTMPTGFVRVLLNTCGGTVAGFGVDTAHARDNALLRAVADGLADEPGTTADRYVLAHLAPPVRTWSDALARLGGQTRRDPDRDLGHLLGFLDGEAYVVATPGELP